MQIENVTRVGFTSWRTAQQQGDLAISYGLLGQVIIDDQRVFTAVTEVLTHGATGIRSQVLQSSRFGGRGNHHDGVGQGAVLFQLAHHVGDGGGLLANRNVDTLNAGIFLVDDGVDRDGGLTNLTVTDDQLTLATTDRDHGIDGFQTGLDRLVNRLTLDNARCDHFDRREAVVVDRTFTVDRLTQGVQHPAQQTTTYRHFQNTASTFYFHSF